MAKRMFSKEIVLHDVFLDMPLSTQALYFHLSMQADDYGFVSPKYVMRTIGANEDDLKLLIAKRYLLAFDSGVVVIKHWQVNNTIRKDRSHPTTYKSELESLTFNEFGAYTEIIRISKTTLEIEQIEKHITTDVVENMQEQFVEFTTNKEVNNSNLKNDNQMTTENRIEYNRIEKNRIEKNSKSTNVDTAKAVYGKPEINEVLEFWTETMGYPIKSKVQANRNAVSGLIKSYGTEATKRFVTWVSIAHGEKFTNKDIKSADFVEMRSNINKILAWARGKAKSEQSEVPSF